MFISPQASTYLTRLFTYLVNKGYFEQVRCLVDNKVPPLLEASSHPPTPLAACLFDMITRPLQLVITSPTNSSEFRSVSDKIYKKFILFQSVNQTPYVSSLYLTCSFACKWVQACPFHINEGNGHILYFWEFSSSVQFSTQGIFARYSLYKA